MALPFEKQGTGIACDLPSQQYYRNPLDLILGYGEPGIS